MNPANEKTTCDRGRRKTARVNAMVVAAKVLFGDSLINALILANPLSIVGLLLLHRLTASVGDKHTTDTTVLLAIPYPVLISLGLILTDDRLRELRRLVVLPFLTLQFLFLISQMNACWGV